MHYTQLYGPIEVISSPILENKNMLNKQKSNDLLALDFLLIKLWKDFPGFSALKSVSRLRTLIKPLLDL